MPQESDECTEEEEEDCEGQQEQQQEEQGAVVKLNTGGRAKVSKGSKAAVLLR